MRAMCFSLLGINVLALNFTIKSYGVLWYILYHLIAVTIESLTIAEALFLDKPSSSTNFTSLNTFFCSFFS